MNAYNIRSDKKYWEEKLAAFLHDPPDKVLALRGHEERGKMLQESLYLPSPDEILISQADQVASGLDRTFLPDRQAGGYVDFSKNPIITHPTGENAHLQMGPVSSGNFADLQQLIEADINGLPQKDRISYLFSLFHYFRHVLPYRLRASSLWGLGWRWGKLPADSRMPDHSIWQHCALVSALYSCFSTSPERKAGLMVFSITPVQDFIARSRKLRDYWSASLILSWLTAEGMGAVIKRYGSDHILYPSPVGQPLIEEMLDRLCGFEKWRGRYSVEARAATVPNKFVFLLPFGEAEEAARQIEQEIKNRWNGLAQRVKELIKKQCFKDVPSDCLKAFDEIFDRQVDHFWILQWASVPVLDEDLLQKAKDYIPEKIVEKAQKLLRKARECQLPYSDSERSEKFFFPLSHDLVQRALAAQKLSPRDQRASEGGTKCQLHPDHEILRFSCVECNRQMCYFTNRPPDKNPRPSEDPCWKLIREKWRKTEFKETERLSAIGIIKRLVYKAAAEDHPLTPFFKEAEGFPSTTEIAAKDWLDRAQLDIEDQGLTRKQVAEWLHRQEASPREDPEIEELSKDIAKRVREVVEKRASVRDEPKVVDRYYAILLMDGDRMGRMLSGGFAARWRDVLHPELLSRIENGKVAEQFSKCFWPLFLDEKRTLSPGVHAAISGALAEFSLYTVPYIVQRYGGHLIYAGGDDICAVFPVSTALQAAREIAWAYNWAFVRRGERRTILRRGGDEESSGTIVQEIKDTSIMQDDDQLLTHLGPGDGISISGGLLIVHHKWPLRASISRAHTLLDIAKDSGRAALALEFQRRAGERRTFVAGWEDKVWDERVWDAFEAVTAFLMDQQISSSLVYKLAELKPAFYVLQQEDLIRLIAHQILRSDSKEARKDEEEVARKLAVLLKGHRAKGEEEKFNSDILIIANFIAEVRRRKRNEGRTVA